jgi:hypothetical protein
MHGMGTRGAAHADVDLNPGDTCGAKQAFFEQISLKKIGNPQRDSVCKTETYQYC